MARILIVPTLDNRPFDPWMHGSSILLRRSAELDSFRQHRLVDDPEDADIILFAECNTGTFEERTRAHPFYVRFPERCFTFQMADTVFPILPGLYASLTNERHRPDHTRTGFYLYLVENSFINERPLSGNEPYLASFVGSRTHRIRSEILAFKRSNILLRDTSADSYRILHKGAPAERDLFWSEYADFMASARFILCPRGHGAGSIRLYESMKMGRAPVIISDAWHPNDGVDWNSCSIRIPESDVSRIPQILEAHADHAAEIGARARAEWETWFSEKVRFHRVVELCLDISRSRKSFGRLQRIYNLRHIGLHPYLYMRSKKSLFKNSRRMYW